MLESVFLSGVLIFLVLLVATGIINMLLGVPYVPSSKKAIQRMTRLAKIKFKDIVYDLGCGDGRLLFYVAKKKNIRAIGYEIAPLPYLLARIKQFFFCLPVSIRFQNFFGANLKNASVIFCYLSPNVLPALAKKIKRECKKGTRIISQTFHIPGLKLKKKLHRNKKTRFPTVYLYEI